MRLFPLVVLTLASGIAMASSGVEEYDPVKFEKRFHKADTNKDGRLSRKEAYAEFPRMPEYFAEIDNNKDGQITLLEVQQAAERRVEAALKATQGARNYGTPVAGQATAQPALPASQNPAFSSQAEARRHYRYEYYESISAEKTQSMQRGETQPISPSSPVFEKKF